MDNMLESTKRGQRLAIRRMMRSEMPKRFWVIYAAAVLICFAVSFLFVGADLGCTAEYPGGRVFEIAFWATGFGCAFLAYSMVEMLFRSRATALLSMLPVMPSLLLHSHMRRALLWVVLSSGAYLACCLPHVLSAPLVMGLSMFFWPLGGALCMIISIAVILYAGQSVPRVGQNSSAGMIFGIAPAIAFGVSLMCNLLMKLMFESILKGKADAFMVACGLLVAIGAGAWIYSEVIFRRRYYAILANFNDSDAVVVNAGYDYLDGKVAERMRMQTPEAALCASFVEAYRRRHALSGVMVTVVGIVLTLVFLQSAPLLHDMNLPLLAGSAMILFSSPWLAYLQPDIDMHYVMQLPILPEKVQRARFRACLQVELSSVITLSLCVGVPYFVHEGVFYGVAAAVLTATLSFLITGLLSWLSIRMPSKGKVVHYGMAIILGGIGLLTGVGL